MIKGYTAGVFDMFHIGHLNILSAAKKCCDYLIVGVTTDELAIKRKGISPYIPYSERSSIVSAIRYVDKTVPQTSYNKMDAWNRYKFDVMFVGDDWQGTETWSQIELDFKSIGVEIKYLPYTTHVSSTKLRSLLDMALQYEV
ncbi:adenylyltransferase/cytidyltransferase family protein [Magnetovirga frankeli]|uniref:adenylyltransferase/cytidyltransferase family protein n=1 Tax=Magnetovirga frankeli TaxID=947516 RepID=UPI001293D5B7|nr:adenylyltransferase/cytidyltransferase family protein [gamma proteobacterium SS-5]